MCALLYGMSLLVLCAFKIKTDQTLSAKLRLLFYKALYINGFNRFAYFAFYYSFLLKKSIPVRLNPLEILLCKIILITFNRNSAVQPVYDTCLFWQSAHGGFPVLQFFLFP